MPIRPRSSAAEHLVGLRGGDEVVDGGGRNASIHEPERQHEHGGGEPAAAQVARLPDLARADGRELRDHGAAPLSRSRGRADRACTPDRAGPGQAPRASRRGAARAARHRRRIRRIRIGRASSRVSTSIHRRRSRSGCALRADGWPGPGCPALRARASTASAVAAVEARRAQALRPPREGLLDQQQARGGEGGTEHRVGARVGANGAALRCVAGNGGHAGTTTPSRSRRRGQGQLVLADRGRGGRAGEKTSPVDDDARRRSAVLAGRSIGSGRGARASPASSSASTSSAEPQRAAQPQRRVRRRARPRRRAAPAGRSRCGRVRCMRFARSARRSGPRGPAPVPLAGPRRSRRGAARARRDRRGRRPWAARRAAADRPGPRRAGTAPARSGSAGARRRSGGSTSPPAPARSAPCRAGGRGRPPARGRCRSARPRRPASAISALKASNGWLPSGSSTTGAWTVQCLRPDTCSTNTSWTS